MPDERICRSNASSKIKTKLKFTFHKKGTDHLYLRGNIFYFRYAFSKEMRERFGQAEIRISLRTGFLHKARKLSRYLWSCLEEEIMPDRERTLEELKDFLTRTWEEKFGTTAPSVYEGQPAPDLNHPEEMSLFKELAEAESKISQPENTPTSLTQLKDYIAQELKKLFPNIQNPTSPAISEIKHRMDRLRQIYLDEIDGALYEVGNEFFINEESGRNYCPVSLWLDQEYVMNLRPNTNNPRRLIRTFFPNVLHELITRDLFTPSDFTAESTLQILNEYNKVLISINQIHFHREHGEYTYEKQFTPPNPPFHHSKSPSHRQECKQPLLLSEFIARFIETKIKDKKWESHTIPIHKNRLDVLVDVLGDIPVCEIDREKMRHFRDVLIQLPPNRTKDKRYKDKSIEEILALRPAKTLSIGTIDTTLTTISGMFEWGIREELIHKNPARDLGLTDPEQAIDKKDALTEEDIKTIFFSGDYKPENFIKPAYYWVPIIALYTGMRVEEICQLHTEDVYEDEGIWVFDVRRESSDGLNDKILKNKNATRKIPIHSDLLELGFLNYLKSASMTSVRLFPELNKTDKSPKYGKQVSKQFSALLKRKGIAGKKSFHSLRHSFSNYFKKLNMHNDLFTQVMGHKQEKLAASRYGSRFSPKQCYDELISKIDWLKN